MVRVTASFTLDLNVAQYLEDRKINEANFYKSEYVNQLIKQDMIKIKKQPQQTKTKEGK